MVRRDLGMKVRLEFLPTSNRPVVFVEGWAETRQTATMEECPGQRDGSTIYYFDGHMYRRNRATDSSTYYRCSTRGCFGRVIQKHSLGTIVQVSPHCHPADQDKHSLRRFLAAIQRRVSTETTPIFDIYEQEASRFPGIENSMPFESLQQQMEKRRRLNETLNNLDT